MTDPISKDLAEGATERGRLVDMAAEHLANMWLRLKYPAPYRAVRHVQGYVIEVSVREAVKYVARTDEDERISD